MMKNSALIFLILVCFPFSVFAEYLKGTVVLENGTQKEGFIEIPKFYDSNELYFKNELKSSVLIFKIKEVKSFQVLDKNNQVLEYWALRPASLKLFAKSENDIKIDKSKCWFFVHRKGKINLLSAYAEYNEYMGSSVPIKSGSTIYYFNRNGKDYCIDFMLYMKGATFVNEYKSLKKTVKFHFDQECPNLSEKFTKEDIKKNGLEYIFELYDKDCGGN